jgi:hypothetical protein
METVTSPLVTAGGERAVAGALALLSFGLLFATRSAQQLRDSLVYAYSAQTGTELWHPHHLIYSPAVRLVWRAMQSVCAECDAVLAGQLHNALWVVLGVAAFFLLTRRIAPLAWAIAAALLLLAGRGTWELATQTTMYAPSAALLTLLAALLLPPERMNRKRMLTLALVLALAVLYHQSNVLFVLPLAVFLLAERGKEGGRTWLTVTLLAGVLVLATYVAAFLSVHGSWSTAEFVRFCLSYTSEICLGGECKASPDQWGTTSNLSLTGLVLLLNSLLWNYVLLPEVLNLVAAPLLGLGLVALTVYHLLRVLHGAPQRALRLLCLVWLWVYILFFWWWLPSYQHPLLSTVVPALLLLLLALREAATWWDGRGRWQVEGPLLAALSGVILLLAARNFQGRIYPLMASTGDSYTEAAALVSETAQDCTFLTSYHIWNHLRYYFGVETALQAKHPMSFFYANEPLPDHYALEKANCVAVEAHYLLPDYVNQDYEPQENVEDIAPTATAGAPVGSNGYTVPERWLTFAGWLLDFEYAGGSVVSSRDFRVVEVADEQQYFVLSEPASRRSVDGLADLFRQLDLALGEPAEPFQAWLSSAGAEFE